MVFTLLKTQGRAAFLLVLMCKGVTLGSGYNADMDSLWLGWGQDSAFPITPGVGGRDAEAAGWGSTLGVAGDRPSMK